MTEETCRLKDVMDLAECLARLGGYRNFSMQGLADRLGAPSSGALSKFGSKEQLAAAVVQRFGDRVYERVGAADDLSTSPEVKLDILIDVYRQTVTDDGQLCLFLVFGAELPTLPPTVQRQVKAFYANIFNWLETLLRRFPQYAPGSGRDARQAAHAIIAALNGAQVCTRAVGEKSIFEDVVRQQIACGLVPRLGLAAKVGTNI